MTKTVGKKEKYLKFRKRSREQEDVENDWDASDDGEEGKDRGSYDLEKLKETEEYKCKPACNGPKRKYAVCFGYLGSSYQGLQINPNCKSVEAELEKALFLAGGFQECNFGHLQKLQWSRAARTDRGVHAVGQCCAMKLSFPTADKSIFISRVNSLLPQDIRVHTLTKVTKNFNSKLTCSQRRYHYLLPTYLLGDAAVLNSSLEDAALKQGDMVDAARKGGYAEPGAKAFLGPEALAGIRSGQLAPYRVNPETLTRLRQGLSQFIGTHPFHNYTSGKTNQDASAMRYIKVFGCGEPFLDPKYGLEWVLLEVVGQSFLLNQVRKMVGMATEFSRGEVSLDFFAESFSDKKIDIPMVPGVGLYLDELFFEQYNLKQQEEKETKQRVAAGKSRANQPRTKDVLVAAAQAAVANAQRQDNERVEAVKDEGAISTVSETNTIQAIQAAESTERLSAESSGPATAGDDQGEIVVGEPILWSSETATMSEMQRFRDNIIWPHVFEEDEVNLHFMYYLDFLRLRKKPQTKKMRC